MNASLAQRETVSVISAHEEHIEGMVECHVAAFPGEFTTLLGHGYLRMSHRFYLEQPGGICLVSLDSPSGRVSGFVKGGDPGLAGQLTHRHMWRMIPVMLLRAMTNRYFRRRMGYHLSGMMRKIAARFGLAKSSEKHAKPADDAPGTWSNLISVCVHPDYRGQGIGKALMEAYRQESLRRGYSFMRLSVHTDNEAAIGLYRRSGWEPILTTPTGTYFRRSTEESA